MTKLKYAIEYTNIEEVEIAQTLSEFADLAEYENGGTLSLQSFLESDDVEDFAKEYFIDYCQDHNLDPEETAIIYSW